MRGTDAAGGAVQSHVDLDERVPPLRQIKAGAPRKSFQPKTSETGLPAPLRILAKAR